MTTSDGPDGRTPDEHAERAPGAQPANPFAPGPHQPGPGHPPHPQPYGWQPPYPQRAPYGQHPDPRWYGPGPGGSPYGPVRGVPPYGPPPLRPPLHEIDLLGGKERLAWRLPTFPVEYQHLLRGRGYAWWKGLLSLAMIGFVFAAAQFVMGIAVGVRAFLGNPEAMTDPSVAGSPEAVAELLNLGDPVNLGLLLMALVVLIPASFLGVRWIHGIRPGYLSSVEGRFRWKWAAVCLAIVLPLWLITLGAPELIAAALAGEPFVLAPPPNWPVLVVVILVLVPLQSAAEEYVFRGYGVQAMGSWFADRRVAILVPTVVGSLLFALLHGSLNPLIMFFLLLFAACAAYVTWRTGGLEAAVVVHAVNNVAVFLMTAAQGDISAGLIGVGEEPQYTPLTVALGVGSNLLFFGLTALFVTLAARRLGVQRRFEPVLVPGAGSAARQGPGHGAELLVGPGGARAIDPVAASVSVSPARESEDTRRD